MGLILKTLGIIDFAALSLLLLSPWLPIGAVLYASYWLMIKGGFFLLVSRDIASLFDLLAGFYIILLTMGVSIDILTVATLIFLGLKAALSIFF